MHYNFNSGGFSNVLNINLIFVENLLSWLKEGNNSEYSILLENSDLYETLESVRDKSRSLEQIAIIIEFRNISHLQEQMKVKYANLQLQIREKVISMFYYSL